MHTRVEICVEKACVLVGKLLLAGSVALAYVGVCITLLPAAVIPAYIAVVAE